MTEKDARTRVWVVDRAESDGFRLVEDDSGVAQQVPRSALPQGLREGDVLRVTIGEDGQAEWSSASADEELRRARLEEGRSAIDRLRRRDPGGDVKL